MNAVKADRDTLVALITERSKLAGTYSDHPHFQKHIQAEADALSLKGDAVQKLVEQNRRWRVEVYEARGLPHDHIPVSEVNAA